MTDRVRWSRLAPELPSRGERPPETFDSHSAGGWSSAQVGSLEFSTADVAAVLVEAAMVEIQSTQRAVGQLDTDGPPGACRA